MNTIEKLLLISHHPEKWWFKITQIHLKYGIAGAMLLELALRKNIVLDDSKIQVNPESKSGDKDYPIFEEIVKTIELSRRLHKPKYWIQKYGRRSRKLKWAFLSGLEKKRLIRIKELKFLWIPYRRAYVLDKHARVMLITKLKDSLRYKESKTEDDIAILGLIEACKMHRIIEPDRSKRKVLRKELKEVIKESPISEILVSTIKQIQVAIAMTIAASSAGAGASH